MTLQEMRHAYAAKCDLQAAIPKMALDAGRAMSKEETDRFNALQAEIDAMDATIKIAEATEARQAALAQPVNEPWRPSATAAAGAPVQENKLDDGGFKNIAEFLHVARSDRSDSRIKNLTTPNVGIAIPPQFASEVLRLDPEEEIILPRANVIPAGDPPDAPFSTPFLGQGPLGALGGVQVGWSGENVVLPQSADPNILPLVLQPRKLAAWMPVSNETLRNWQASGAFVSNLLRMAVVEARDMAFIAGNGVGRPLGFLDPGATGVINVIRAGGGAIGYADLAAMRQALYGNPAGAFWLASQGTMAELMQIQDPGGRYIYVGGDATKGVADSLLGLPIKYTGSTPALGNRGDIVLINPKYYLIKQGSGPFLDTSEHFQFTQDNTIFKIVANYDGQPWVNAPLTLRNGVTQVSPYVVLQ
jgi:HK97 family phage major capsid protein